MNNVENKRKNNIFFSVILTTFNSEIYIKSALRNLFFQKFKEFEVIVIDDGSTDNTLKIVKKYKDKLNFKILSLKHSGSPARSRNLGIKYSSGKYLCFFDCDDSFYSEKLYILHNLIKKNNSDVFYHDVYLKEVNKNLYCKIVEKKNPFKDLILNGNKIVLSSSCVKKKFLKNNKIKFNETKKFISVEDYDFWIKIAKNNGKFFLIQKILGAYNLNQFSISKNRVTHYLNTLNLLNYYKKSLNNYKLSFLIRKIRVTVSFIKISIYEKNANFLLFKLKSLLRLKSTYNELR